MRHTAPPYIHSTLEETVDLEDRPVAVSIEFEATAAEPRTYWHPGCPADITLIGVTSLEPGFSDDACLRYVEEHWYEFVDRIADDLAQRYELIA